MPEPVGEVGQAMLLIQSIDRTAKLEFSEYTRCWYIDSCLWLSQGYIQSGIVEHRGTPEQAVLAFLERLRTAELDHIIVGKSADGERRHYRWNGGTFVEEPVKWFTPKPVQSGSPADGTTEPEMPERPYDRGREES